MITFYVRQMFIGIIIYRIIAKGYDIPRIVVSLISKTLNSAHCVDKNII